MLLFFDVETTGLPKRRNAKYTDIENWPRIVSISWAFCEHSEVPELQREAVVKPQGFTIPAESTAIHGITTAHARKHGRAIKTVLRELLRDTASYKPDLLIAHNMDYDRNVILSEYLRADLDLALASLSTYCTMQSTVNMCRIPRGGGYKWPRLDELHNKLFGEGFEGAHNAGADVLACARCYFALQGRTNEDAATYEEDDKEVEVDEYADELIDRIITWSWDNDRFDTDFVESLQGQLHDRGWLTDAQIEALEHIIDRWNVD